MFGLFLKLVDDSVWETKRAAPSCLHKFWQDHSFASDWKQLGSTVTGWPLWPTGESSPSHKVSTSPKRESWLRGSSRVKLWQWSGAVSDTPRERCGKPGKGTNSAFWKISARIPVVELCELCKLLNLSLLTVSFLLHKGDESKEVETFRRQYM